MLSSAAVGRLFSIERMGLQDEDGGVVVLVVGDETTSKSQVADRFAKLFEASPCEPTTAGVRTFTSTSCNTVVVDTVSTESFPVVGQDDLSQNRRQQIARQWISQNSLRRLLLGKHLYVVCVLTCPKEISLEAYERSFGWLDILGVMFQEHKKAIRMLVNTQHIDEGGLSSAQKNIDIVLNQREFMSSNTKYLSWGRQGETLKEQFKVEDCVPFDGSTAHLLQSSVGDNMHCQEATPQAPFLLREPALPEMPQCPPRTPWDPERVILFGRTGSGKSTLAQMLTKGKLDPESKEFASNSGVRGKTKAVSFGHGRGWYVVDTPGFGEPNLSQSTICTQEAEQKIKKFVKNIDGLFTHFLFVVKKDRIDELEVRLWKFFVTLFDHNHINDHFSIVFTNADDEWVKMNQTHLMGIFEGCGSFLCAEFPSSQSDDDEWEGELQEIRKESLQRMEDALANLSRNDVVCEFGIFSRSAVMNRNGHYRELGLRGVRHNASILTRFFATMSCLRETLTIDQDIALLPF